MSSPEAPTIPDSPPPATEPSPVPPPPPPVDPPPADRTFTQADIDRIVSATIAKERKNHTAETAELRKQAADLEKVKRERETETEKALREAREQVRLETLGEVRPRLVAAEFRAAAAGRIDAARLSTLTEDIDMSRYLLEDGSVDVAKVSAKVDAWAPAKTELDPPKGPRPDPSQGARNTKVGGLDAGRAMFEARRKKTRT